MTTRSAVARLAVEPQPFGRSLRAWREARKRSQLDLALDANVSQRHLSFLESGRAQPSREMVLQLAEALDVPLRERNLLLGAAGFAPLYQERSLDDSAMAAVRQALDLTLKHHEPFPALVVNRSWEIVMQNEGATRFLALLGDPDEVWSRVDPGGGRNAMRLTFHPLGLQPLIRNWEQVATPLLARLQREVTVDPANTKLAAVFEEIVAYQGIPARWRNAAWVSPPLPILPLRLGMGDLDLEVFTMISTFGTAQDITADELRVETFFPADDFTARFLRGFAPAEPNG